MSATETFIFILDILCPQGRVIRCTMLQYCVFPHLHTLFSPLMLVLLYYLNKSVAMKHFIYLLGSLLWWQAQHDQGSPGGVRRLPLRWRLRLPIHVFDTSIVWPCVFQRVFQSTYKLSKFCSKGFGLCRQLKNLYSMNVIENRAIALSTIGDALPSVPLFNIFACHRLSPRAVKFNCPVTESVKTTFVIQSAPRL